MPAVQCLRGMNSPANGIFFRRRAALMLGRRRQETRGSRPRALPPPFPPEGAARRGGSKDREQSKGATGRTALMRVGSARADGRSLRGSGSVFEQRQDVMRRRTAAGEGCPGMAAGTTTGIAAGFVFAAWPANGAVAPAIVAPAIAAPDGGVPAFRRCPDSVPPIRQVRGLRAMRTEERRRNIALRSGGRIFRPGNPANTAACAHLRAARTRCSGARSMHDNCCYRASIR